jgi:hypothetical protein
MAPHHLHQVASMEVGAIDKNHSPKHGTILELRKRDERWGVMLRASSRFLKRATAVTLFYRYSDMKVGGEFATSSRNPELFEEGSLPGNAEGFRFRSPFLASPSVD